jgi:DNA-binding IclR family transcriptional regulator
VSAVQSVERAVAILRALTTGPARVTELAARTQLPKSTVSRLLSTLEGLDAVEQSGNGGPYRLGRLAEEIGAATGPTRALPELAHPFLLELSLLTGEAAGLSVREGSMVRYLAQTTPSDEVQVRDWTGAEIPAHVTPSGLVILAYLPEAEVEALLAEPLVAFTDDTVTDPDRIRARLAAIRDAGSIWLRGEFAPEASSVAAPVFGLDGTVVAAIHAHGPSYRFPGDRSPAAVAEHVRAVAARLSQRLAGAPDPG